MQSKQLKAWALATTLLSGAGVSAPAFAQEAEEAASAPQDTITVTGSRIARQDFVSNSPVATVDAEQFALTGTVNTESLLNTLPQTIPGLDRTSNNPGNGTATVDLRGLGSSRTLVLVNGKRMVPTTQGGTVDINNIPTALIERVEVVTGGASAVYGSDAVAGVVNFILKDDFEGVEFNAGYEITEQGDAQIFNTSLTLGGNFDNGRGNAVLSLGYNDRQDLFQGDRDFAFFAQFDDGAGNLFDGGSSGVPEGRLSGPFDFDGDGVADGAGIFNPDGTLRLYDGSTDAYNYAPVNYIQLPQERIQATALANYEVNRHFEIYASALFAHNDVPQQLAATPIFEPRSGTQTYTLDGNPFIAPSAQQIISDATGAGVDTDGDGIDDEGVVGGFGVRRRLLEVGERRSEDQFNAFQLQFGVRGELAGTWEYDVYFQEGRVQNSTSQIGNVNVDRFFQALNLATDASGDVILDADGNPSCSDPTGGCAPINIFGLGNISDEAADFISTRVVADLDYEVTNFVANVTGDTSGLFELPGGPIGLAFGAEYREEFSDFRPSQDLAVGTISGFNAAPPSGGKFDVYGLYGEAYLPILTGVEFAEILALELAYRTEDYSTAGQVEAYKIAGEWAPIEDLRFRASFNTAVRAPSISELFAPQGEGFPGAADPCASGFTGDATLRAVCEATGVPAANVGSSLIDLPSGQVRQLSGGNPNLQAEEAETLTVGFVATPSFIEGLSFSVDYFEIEILDVISAFGGGANNVITTCYTDPDLGGAGSPFCNAITREADGLITRVDVIQQNVASLNVEGFDVIADYSFDLVDTFGFGSGEINLGYLGTITETNTLVPFDGGTPITCAGEFGVDCDDPIAEYKHRVTARWMDGPFTAQVMWRYIGGTDDDEGLPFEVAVKELDAANYFDAAGSWQINDTLQLTVGIDNLFDKKPPIIGDNQEQANTYPATYDVFGRTYWANIRAQF
ncbi:MAG: TonB-dependent receptor [Oceanicaulis sp.]